MSAIRSASTGTPYLNPKLTTVIRSFTVSGVPKALATLSVSWCTLSGVVSMTRSASPRRLAITARSCLMPSSSRPLPWSGCGRRAASWRRTRMSSEASRKSSVVRRVGNFAASCARSESKNTPARTSTTAATGWLDALLLVDETDHVADQLGRQVVDHEVAEVLELLGGGAATRAGHPGHDDELALVPLEPGRGAVGCHQCS